MDEQPFFGTALTLSAGVILYGSQDFRDRRRVNYFAKVLQHATTPLRNQDAVFTTGSIAGDIMRNLLYQVASFLIAMTFAFFVVYPVLLDDLENIRSISQFLFLTCTSVFFIG